MTRAKRLDLVALRDVIQYAVERWAEVVQKEKDPTHLTYAVIRDVFGIMKEELDRIEKRYDEEDVHHQ